jgi:hypothetical protein
VFEMNPTIEKEKTMTQKASPVSDDSQGSWTPVPLFARINGATGNDGGAIISGMNVPGDTFAVSLSKLAQPALPGQEVLTVRLAGDGSTRATVVLLQGDQAIASQTVTPGSSFQDFALTLTAAQVAQITDYTDLHVQVTAGDVTVACCPDNPLPAILHATFSNGTGDCTCLDGLTVELIWFSGQEWDGDYTACSGTSALELSCSPFFGWQLTGGGHCPIVMGSPTTSSCSPFSLHFSGMMVTNCCSGTVDVTVTS